MSTRGSEILKPTFISLVANGIVGGQPMRIAVFVEFFPPNLGSDRRIYELMTRLSKRHEIHFVVLPPFRMLAGKLFLPQNRFHFLREETVVGRQGVLAHYVTVNSLMFKFWKKSYKLAYILTVVTLFFKIFKSMRRINPDVIVLNYPSVYTGILGHTIGKRLLRKPTLLDFDDLIAQYTIDLLDLPPNSLAAKLCILIQGFIAKASDRVIAPSSYIERYALHLAIAPDKIVAIPNGVDTEYFDPRRFSAEDLRFRLKLGNKKICVYCGRLDNWAGTNVILHLCDKFGAKDPDVAFVIVGRGAEEGRLFPKNAVIVGEVPYRKVPEMLAIADVVLVPFPDNEVSRAASPLKLFEGMAMGKATVASEVDGIKDVILNQESGVLVKPSDIAAWVEAITDLLNNPSMARRIGGNARRIVKGKYDWKLLAERYEKNFYV